MLHGLVVLPVLLALFGTFGNKQDNVKKINLSQMNNVPQNSFDEPKKHVMTQNYMNGACFPDPDCP